MNDFILPLPQHVPLRITILYNCKYKYNSYSFGQSAKLSDTSIEGIVFFGCIPYCILRLGFVGQHTNVANDCDAGVLKLRFRAEGEA